MMDPPVGGTFWFQIFIQAPSPEIWSETISGAEGGSGAVNGVACFWATSLEKIFGGVIAIISFRPGGWMQQSAVPRCAILSEAREASGSETARVHHGARQRSGRLAARGARAGAPAYPAAVLPNVRSRHAAVESIRRILPGPARSWLCERPEHRHRLPLLLTTVAPRGACVGQHGSRF